MALITNLYMSSLWLVFYSSAELFFPWVRSIVPFLIVVPLALALFPFVIDTDRFKNFRKNLQIKIRLALMPLFWIAINSYSVIFAWKEGAPTPSALVSYTPAFILLAFILYALFLIYKNKGWRIVTAVLFGINLYFSLFAYLLAAMAISGTYL